MATVDIKKRGDDAIIGVKSVRGTTVPIRIKIEQLIKPGLLKAGSLLPI